MRNIRLSHSHGISADYSPGRQKSLSCRTCLCEKANHGKQVNMDEVTEEAKFGGQIQNWCDRRAMQS